MVKLNRMVIARENVDNDARKDSLTHCTLTVHIVISKGRVKIDLSSHIHVHGKFKLETIMKITQLALFTVT